MKLSGEFVIVITGRTEVALSSDTVTGAVGPMLGKLVTGKEIPDSVWRSMGLTVTQAPAPPPKAEFKWPRKLPG